MNAQIANLIGRYPITDKIEETLEYQKNTLVEKAKANLKWAPIYAAAKIVSTELDRHDVLGCKLESTLDSTRKKEDYLIDKEVKRQSKIEYNQRKLDGMIEFLESKEIRPLLITREIKYCRELIGHCTYGDGLEFLDTEISHFSQALDFQIEDDYIRLEIGGDCNLIDSEPLLRINQISLRNLKKPEYIGTVEYLKKTSLEHVSPIYTCITGHTVLGFTIQTEMEVDEFHQGKDLASRLGRLKASKPTSEYKSLIPSIKRISEIIDEPLNKVTYHLTESSNLHYDKKTGKPLLLNEGVRR